MCVRVLKKVDGESSRLVPEINNTWFKVFFGNYTWFKVVRLDRVMTVCFE
jgi:hypothetical protein